MTGYTSGIRRYLEHVGLSPDQFAIPYRDTIDQVFNPPNAEIQFMANHYLACDDSGYDTPDKKRRRRKKRAAIGAKSKKGGGLSCLVNEDDYKEKKFRKKYDVEYDAKKRAVTVFTDKVMYTVTHPRVVARVFAQHAREVDALFQKAFTGPGSSVIHKFMQRNQYLLDRMADYKKARSNLAKLTKTNTKTRHGKSKMNMLATVSVILGSNDLSTQNMTGVDMVFASSDLMQSSAQLLTAILPKNAPHVSKILLSKISNSKFLNRFNSVGTVVSLINVVHQAVKTKGVHTFHQGYWMFRAVTNTLSIASKIAGRIFLPMVALDVGMMLQQATDNGRATLHEMHAITPHLTSDQKSEVYMSGFMNRPESLSGFQKFGIIRSGIEQSIDLAEELMSRMPFTKAVVIPYRQGMRLNHMRDTVATREVLTGRMGSRCEYKDVDSKYELHFDLKDSKDNPRRDYTRVSYDHWAPTKRNFRGNNGDYIHCMSIAEDHCNFYTKRHLSHTYAIAQRDAQATSRALSRCLITDDNWNVVFRPADEYIHDWCLLRTKLQTEMDKRWNRIIAESLHVGEANQLMRPVLSHKQKHIDIIEYPYGSLIETRGHRQQVDFPFYSRSCSSAGVTRWKQPIYHQFVTQRDLIVTRNHNDKTRNDTTKIVFFPVPKEAVLPDHSVAFLAHSGSTLAIGDNSTVVASEVSLTRNTKLRRRRKDSSSGVTLSVLKGDPNGQKLVILTDVFSHDNTPLDLFSNDTLLTLYFEMLRTPHLKADWLTAVHAKDVDGGLMFVGPMTRYVSIGNQWTVVTFGDFANLQIVAGTNLTIYETSELSLVRIDQQPLAVAA